MKETLLSSRPLHYFALLLVFGILTVGGILTMSCNFDSLPAAMLVPGQEEDVIQTRPGSIEFKPDSDAMKAEYELPKQVTLGDGKTKADCLKWAIVKSIDPITSNWEREPGFGLRPKKELTLADFEEVDLDDVTLNDNMVTIDRDHNPGDRSINFVCEYVGNTPLGSPFKKAIQHHLWVH